MAFLQPLDDDEQQKQKDGQQQQMPGTAPAGAISNGASQMQPETPRTSGSFVNLQSFLDANKGRADRVSAAGDKIFSNEQSRFDQAASPIKDANYTANRPDQETLRSLVDRASGIGGTFSGARTANGVPGSAPTRPIQGGILDLNGRQNPSVGSAIQPYVGGGGLSMPGMASPRNQTLPQTAPAAPRQSGSSSEYAKSTLGGLLNQKYGGPMTVDYSQDENNKRDLGLLSDNPNTIVDVMARDSINKGTYGTGLRNLDNALMSIDPGVAAAQSAIKTKGGEFDKNIGGQKAALENRAKGFADDANSASSTIRQILSGMQGGIGDSVASQVSAKNAADKAAREGYLNDYKNWYGTTHNGLEANRGSKPFGKAYNQNFNNATAENVISNDDSSRLSTLAGLLGGGNVIAKNGTYNPFRTFASGEKAVEKPKDVVTFGGDGNDFDDRSTSQVYSGSPEWGDRSKQISTIAQSDLSPEDLARLLGLG